jgi:hypothetical protein
LSPVSRIVIARRPCGLHLRQRHALLDHVLNAITNDRDPVPVFTAILPPAPASM